MVVGEERGRFEEEAVADCAAELEFEESEMAMRARKVVRSIQQVLLLQEEVVSTEDSALQIRSMAEEYLLQS